MIHQIWAVAFLYLHDFKMAANSSKPKQKVSDLSKYWVNVDDVDMELYVFCGVEAIYI